MLKKTISALLALVICISLAPAVFAQEIYETETPQDFDRLQTEKALVLYSSQEITDLQALRLRAENGVDDLKQRSGTEMLHSATVTNGVCSDPISTTQLLSIIEINGVEYEQYVTTTIVDFAVRPSADAGLYGSANAENTRYNYHLFNRIYYTKDANDVYYFFQHSMTSFQTTGAVSASPKLLRIENGVNWDPTEPGYQDPRVNYTNIVNPTAGNPYTLNAPYSGSLIGYLAQMTSTAILTLSDGTSVSCTSGKNCN